MCLLAFLAAGMGVFWIPFSGLVLSRYHFLIPKRSFCILSIMPMPTVFFNRLRDNFLTFLLIISLCNRVIAVFKTPVREEGEIH